MKREPRETAIFATHIKFPRTVIIARFKKKKNKRVHSLEVRARQYLKKQARVRVQRYRQIK